MTLEVKGLRVAAPGKILIDEVSLKLVPGQLLTLVGANGAGKSSLLRAIGGELSASAGSVHWCGQALDSLSLRDKAQRVAMLPQLSTLAFPFRAREVVCLGRSPHHSGVRRDAQVVGRVMALMDVLHLADRRYTHLSGGEKQRVQLARVMAQVWDENSSVERLLLLDEPSSALDLGHQQQLLAALESLRRQRITVVMAVHDLNLASACADRVLALKSGTAVSYGSPAEVFRESILNEVFDARVQVLQDILPGRPVILGLP